MIRNRIVRRSRTTQQSTPKQVTKLYYDFQQNIDHIKQLYTYGTNRDFQSREFTAKGPQKKVNIFFYTSIVDTKKINQDILKPLVEFEGKSLENILTTENITTLYDFEAVINHINSGKAVLIIEECDYALSVEVSNFQHRAVEKPENENVLKGPKEAFTESSIINLSLIRKRIHNKQLIAEGVNVGERYTMEATLLYIDDVVNKDILQNVKKRLHDIKSDGIRNIELLEQYLEERPYSIIPTILYTERPDRAASFLEDGFVVLIMDNSSSCLILPATFWSFIHSPEDRYLSFMFGNFSRIIRFLAFFTAMFVSAFYIAITNFHSEMIPPDLLLAITSARERVPFPAVVEVLLMEMAFELIREAGIRIPSPLGPTIGIVGALILGQAAVQANIVSPIVVIIAALSGLSSFAVASIDMNYTVRISRYIFMFAASFFGIFSLVGAFLLWIMYLVSIKSFGVSFLSPMTPTYKSPKDTIIRNNLLKKELFRPGQIKPQDKAKKDENG
ncbi:spore germination protein [Radiobacillus kanasensis]|uniref:spore germination protein n=1 Tax=Radiobacillus kanasensis TaxID=2844358 RepID=UPI001E32093F|nr:spore germination protein [Radiobacillus kanasensis]UFT99450.1 spore germination protein [Radiobacillus kanasensis]